MQAFRTALPRMLSPLLAKSTAAGRASVGMTGVRSIGCSSARRSDHLFVHRDTPENNAKIPFSFTPENTKLAEEIIARYPPQYKKGATIPLLDLGQRQLGWTSLSVMNHVAEMLEMPKMRVYEVATFYTMFNRSPVGKNFVQLCTTTPCMLGGCGSNSILDTIKDHLKISPGETTKDGKFTLVEVECLGACSNAPMMAVGDDFYEDLTPESTIKVLNAFSKGEKPQSGPQSNRKQSENSAGLTSLLEKPYGPGEHCLPEFA